MLNTMNAINTPIEQFVMPLKEMKWCSTLCQLSNCQLNSFMPQKEKKCCSLPCENKKTI